MSSGLIAFVTLIYLGVAISEMRNRNHGMALAFAGYALANIGLIMAL